MEFAKKVSEYVSPVLTVASALYECYKEVKNNKERCGRLVERVKVIESVVKAVTDEDLDNPLVQGALTNLKKILTSAVELVRKHADTHWLFQAMKANNLKDHFVDLNNRLSEVSDQLSLCLQLEQLKKLREVFEAKRREEEDQHDAADDQLGWQRVMASVEDTRAVVKDVHDVVDNTDQKVSAIQHQMASAQRDLRDIKDKVGTHEGAGPKSSSASPVKASDKVKKSRIELIKRIGKALLKDLLDHLQDASVISGRERNHVLEEYSVIEDQVTCLVDMVWKKGEKACEIFLSLLKKRDENLYDELGL